MSEIDFDKDGVFPAEAPPVEISVAAAEPASGAAAPIEPPVPPAQPLKKRGKGLRIAAIVLGAVVVLGVAAAFAVPAIIRAVNPKAAVLYALSKTMDNAGFGDAAAVAESLERAAYRQSFSLRLGDRYPAELDTMYNFGQSAGQLAGTGLTYTLEMDRASKELAVNLGVDIGAYHAADLRFFAENNLFSFGSPQFTSDKFYQFNTESFGADWNASPYWSTVEGVDPTLSFNLFDEVTAEKNPAVTAETAALLEQFAADLNKASPMTKEGSGAYTLTVPADALQTYLKSTAQALEEDEAYSAVKPEGIYLPDLVNQFQDGASVLFIVEKGAVNRMDLILPITADGEKLLLRFVMEQGKNGALTLTLTGGDTEDSAAVSVSAVVQVSADRSARQMSVDLPEILVTADGESLSLRANVAMEPLTDGLSFRPEETLSFMELDRNGVLELLMDALGGLQEGTDGATAGN